MAIELQNSMFIHIPKCGGRKVTTLLTTYVKGARIVGDRVLDAHKSPDTDKKVFAFVRHPATFIRSLWTHRSRIKNGKPKFNWQQYLRMEKECASRDYNEFVENVLNGTDYVYDYYMHYTGKYSDIQYGKMENLVEDLIFILKENGESFDENAMRRDAGVVGANRLTGKPSKLKDTMNEEQLSKLVNEVEKKLCERFGYNEV